MSIYVGNNTYEFNSVKPKKYTIVAKYIQVVEAEVMARSPQEAAQKFMGLEGPKNQLYSDFEEIISTTEVKDV